MGISELITDPYERAARLSPAILTILPAWIGVAAWFPVDTQLWGGVTAIGGTVALGMLLSQLSRDRGKRIEKALFVKWGGVPSIQFQSFIHSPLNAATLHRIHTILSRDLPNLNIPMTEEEERQNPDKAMEAYWACSDYLRSMTRDRSRFHLVFAENRNYGFRRNMLGLRPYGILIGILGLCAVLLRTAVQWFPEQWQFVRAPNQIVYFYVVICAVLFIVWSTVIKENWARVPAEEYAKRLLEASNNLP